MHIYWITALALAVFLQGHNASAQNSAPAETPIPADDRLNAVVWTMTSAEYEGTVRMGYAVARVQLDTALADKSRTAVVDQVGDFSKLPPAIIMDIDETVLATGPYQVRLMDDTVTRPADLMARWVEDASAKALPGVLEFIAYAESKGVTVFFVTNRNSEKEAATRRNLEAVGIKLPAGRDTVLLEREQTEWTNDKTTRRAFIAATHRVLMLLGDDLNDFISVARLTSAERRTVVARESARWGRDWIIFPNPMYGSWESAAINFQFRASPEDRRRIKNESIRAE